MRGRTARGLSLALLAAGLLLGASTVSAAEAPPRVVETGPVSRDAAPDAMSWPHYRGGPQQLGVAGAGLPPKLGLRWSFETGDEVRSSAVVADGRVFIGSMDKHLYALDLATGRKVWAFAAAEGIEASPTVVDELVVVGAEDGRLHALERATGAERWVYKTEASILGAANVARLGAGASGKAGARTLIIVGSYDGKLHAVDAATGAGVWTYTTENYVHASPAIHKGRAVVGGCDAHVHVVAVADGRPVTKVRAGSQIGGSVALDGDLAWVGHYGNEMVCLDVDLGEAEWRYSDRRFPYFSSAAVGARVVVFGGRDKRVHAVERETGKPLWTFATKGKVDSSPVIAGDEVVVGSSDGRLYVLGLADGKARFTWDVGAAIVGTPAVAAGMIVVGAADGRVYGMGAPVVGASR